MSSGMRWPSSPLGRSQTQSLRADWALAECECVGWMAAYHRGALCMMLRSWLQRRSWGSPAQTRTCVASWASRVRPGLGPARHGLADRGDVGVHQHGDTLTVSVPCPLAALCRSEAAVPPPASFSRQITNAQSDLPSKSRCRRAAKGPSRSRIGPGRHSSLTGRGRMPTGPGYVHRQQ
jgi:hypothetical protein